MPRKYEHVSEYKKEIIEMCNQEMTLREIGQKLGFAHKQIRDFKTIYNKKTKENISRNIFESKRQATKRL